MESIFIPGKTTYALVYTVKEACEVLRVSRSKLTTLRNQGLIKTAPKINLNDKVLITRASVNAFLGIGTDISQDIAPVPKPFPPL